MTSQSNCATAFSIQSLAQTTNPNTSFHPAPYPSISNLRPQSPGRLYLETMTHCHTLSTIPLCWLWDQPGVHADNQRCINLRPTVAASPCPRCNSRSFLSSSVGCASRQLLSHAEQTCHNSPRPSRPKSK